MAETPPILEPDAEAAWELLVLGVEEPPLPAHGDAESAAWLREILQDLGFTQGTFARFMLRRGDTRPKRNIQRSIQRMCSGQARVSGEMRVLLGLMLRSKQKKMARTARKRDEREAPWNDLSETHREHPSEGRADSSEIRGERRPRGEVGLSEPRRERPSDDETGLSETRRERPSDDETGLSETRRERPGGEADSSELHHGRPSEDGAGSSETCRGHPSKSEADSSETRGGPPPKGRAVEEAACEESRRPVESASAPEGTPSP